MWWHVPSGTGRRGRAGSPQRRSRGGAEVGDREEVDRGETDHTRHGDRGGGRIDGRGSDDVTLAQYGNRKMHAATKRRRARQLDSWALKGSLYLVTSIVDKRR